MKFTESTEIDRVEQEEANRYTAKAFKNLEAIVNNGVTLYDNFDAKFLTVTFVVADTDVATLHGLGRVPNGYIILGTSAAMSVYDGVSANTTSILYLRSNAAGRCRIMVF